MGNGTPHGLVETGRGGACVPARVALQGRIHRSNPLAQCMYFWYENAATRTFGRARRRRLYVFHLRELRVDVRPYARLSIKGAFVVFIRCGDGTFIWRGKGGFHFYLYLCI